MAYVFYFSMRIKKAALLFIISILSLVAANAQNNERWYNRIFIEGSALNYFAPLDLNEVIKPKLGFRGALGYELWRFRFALESGYTHIEGTNPLVLDISLIPLVFKFGYNQPLFFGFGVQADLSAGFIFSRTSRYETAIGMLTGNLLNDKTRSPITGARLYLTWTVPWKFIKIYAGGGADIILETGGLLPLPLVEAGISIKPLFHLKRKTPALPAVQEIPQNIVYIPPEEKEEITVDEADAGENVICKIIIETEETVCTEEDEPEPFERVFTAVYFPPDETVPFQQYLSVLDDAGVLLLSNPALHITLRGYSAPFSTAGGQENVSRQRAEYCADYLTENFGIEKERIAVEYYGANAKPEFADNTWDSYRCAELIIEEPNIEPFRGSLNR